MDLQLLKTLEGFQATKVIAEVIAEEKRTISYRPNWARELGSVNAAILLQQMMFWWVNKQHQPFFKFKEPCKHPLYKPGDSWTEELGMTSREFDTALSKISFTAAQKKAIKKKHAMKFGKWQCLVDWKITQDRKTIYVIDEKTFQEFTHCIYLSTNPHLGKQQKRIYVNDKSAFIKETEITTDNTTYNVNSNGSQHTKVSSEKQKLPTTKDSILKEDFSPFKNKEEQQLWLARAEGLCKQIAANHPRFAPELEAKVLQHAVTMYNCKRLDGLSDDEIKKALDYALNDPFWEKNFMSPAKMRKKSDKMGCKYIMAWLDKAEQNTQPQRVW